MSAKNSISNIGNISVAGSKTQQRVADISEMIFKLEEKDKTSEICDMLMMTVSRLETADIRRVSEMSGQIALVKTLDGLWETYGYTEELLLKLQEAMTELYKQGELLKLLGEQLEECSKKLEEDEKDIDRLISGDPKTDELILRRKKDMAASKMLAANNIIIIKSKYAENRTLAKGISTLALNTVPLWRTQITDARRSCGRADINRSLDTADTITAAIKKMVLNRLMKKFS